MHERLAGGVMAFSGKVENLRGVCAARLRRRLGDGLERLRGGAWTVVQTAMSVGLAWYLASMLLGSERPVIAVIAAVICVGALAGQTLRRAAEWLLGLAVGLSVAGTVMHLIGTGPFQTAIIVGAAMAVALVVRSGIMFVTEAGVSATLVATLDPSTYGLSPDRLLEALVGGAAALAVSALVPSNPKARVERASRRILEDLAVVYKDVADALAEGDAGRAEFALDEARRMDERVASLRETLDDGFQIARYAPPRRRCLDYLGYHAAAVDQLDLAVRNTRVLARAGVNLVRERGDSTLDPPGAVRDLALAVETLSQYLESPEHPLDTRRFALEAARRATDILEERSDLETSVLVGQIRSTSFDLLRASGMGSDEALETFKESTKAEEKEPETASCGIRMISSFAKIAESSR
ncbi:MAG: FUSC family protein [Rubrobacter sp.]|nr:FUSC family protein [Rubrobacter sp.]